MKPLPRLVPWSGQNRARLLNILLILLAIAAFVLVSALAARLEKRFNLVWDHSFNAVTTQSDLSRQALANIGPSVHVYAVFTPGKEDASLIGLLQRFAAANPLITYSLENLMQNPLLANKISDSPGDRAVSTDCLIVDCAATGRTRVLDSADFMEQSYDPQAQQFVPSGITYEKSLTEAILFVAAKDVPTIQLLRGHDELDDQETAALKETLAGANYAIQPVHLLLGEPLDPNNLLMILSPRKDLSQQEVTQVERFASAGGALFITTDYDDPHPLPRFDALLRAYGIQRQAGMVVAQPTAKGSYYQSPAYLMPYMATTQATAALVASGENTLILPAAGAFSILSGDASTVVEPVLKSASAYLHVIEGENDTLQKRDSDVEGEFILALLSDRAHENGNHSKAFVIGSSQAFTDRWMYANTYSLQFLQSILDHLARQQRISLPITARMAFRAPLDSGASPVPLIILALPPLLVIAAAALIFIPRRRKQS